MAVYAIGDIQGCFDELKRLLKQIEFNPLQDQLWFAGDLVNRGPKSLETLRYVKGLGSAAVTVLGNHDLHFLAVAHGYGKKLAKDTLLPILEAPDRDELVHWLRHQRVLHHDADLEYTMIHAGLPPQWDLAMAKSCAAELEACLQADDYVNFIADMYGNKPNRWSKKLEGQDRLRLITNAFTRLRYCYEDGSFDMKHKGAPGSQPAELTPWFAMPKRKTAKNKFVFGHWSTLGVGEHKNALSLDGGCLWGGELVAVRLDSEPLVWHALSCEGACQPS